MALKQSHINQLNKIIAAAEKLITAIEREMQSQASGGGNGSRGGGGGRRKSSSAKRGAAVQRAGRKATGKAQGKAARGGRKAASNGEKRSGNSGTRRNRAQTAEFRQSILKELEGGTAVADLAAKHGITPAYIYQIKSRAEG